MIAAIVPAAGRSERMGRPKLILPIAGATVIARVVSALRTGGVIHVIVVTPPADSPGAAVLGREAAAAGAVVVVPAERPADMRGSFEFGLQTLEDGPRPAAVLLVPADSAGITPELVALVLEQSRALPSAIVIPTFQGKRGHPIALPWAMALLVRGLPFGAGINALIALHAADVFEIEVDHEGAVADLDTPEDYERWMKAAGP